MNRSRRANSVEKVLLYVLLFDGLPVPLAIPPELLLLPLADVAPPKRELLLLNLPPPKPGGGPDDDDEPIRLPDADCNGLLHALGFGC